LRVDDLDGPSNATVSKLPWRYFPVFVLQGDFPKILHDDLTVGGRCSAQARRWRGSRGTGGDSRPHRGVSVLLRTGFGGCCTQAAV